MPRRHRSVSKVSGGDVPVPRTQSPAVQAIQQSKRLLDMSPAIYENNMKVLHRREPSIVSIFDQFSHVCLYHYNGKKWEKQGYEGSMFLFEKRTYPSYGLFILNRMGTDDYIRPIHPEDDMDVVGDYLMYRFYPEYTSKRLELGLPHPIPPEHRAYFDMEIVRMAPLNEPGAQASTSAEKKGTAVTIGLWMFATDAREPLKDVMMRLHAYIKRNEPYPEEFRYGPGRPPPPNPHLRTASRASNSSSLIDEEQTPHVGFTHQLPQAVNGSSIAPAHPAMSANSTEIDKLFAKLMPSASSTPATEPQLREMSATPSSGMSMQDILSKLGGSNQTPAPAVSTPPASVVQNKGLALLDSIFASAAPISARSGLPPRAEDIQIVSPKPTSNTLPHVLNQDMISSMLGLSPSRASSAAPSSAESRRSAVNRYEGDAEDSESEFLSEASSANVPQFSIDSVPSAVPSGAPSKRISGDVTPRAVVRGIGPFSPPPPSQHLIPTSMPPSQTLPQQPPIPPAKGPSPAPRKLVPFEADSDLWPYPRAPLDDRAEDDADVVELDFRDTRALADPTLFSKSLKEKQGRAKTEPGKPAENGKSKEKGEKGKGDRKKRIAEKTAERERQREEILNGWDDPVTGRQAQTPTKPPQTAILPAVNGNGKEKAVLNGPQNRPRSPQHVNGAQAGVQSNGFHAGPHAKAAPAQSWNGAVVGAAQDPVAAAAGVYSKIPGGLAKNDFVRELLTLIHTDKAFVDNLYQSYLSHTA